MLLLCVSRSMIETATQRKTNRDCSDSCFQPRGNKLRNNLSIKKKSQWLVTVATRQLEVYFCINWQLMTCWGFKKKKDLPLHLRYPPPGCALATTNNGLRVLDLLFLWFARSRLLKSDPRRTVLGILQDRNLSPQFIKKYRRRLHYIFTTSHNLFATARNGHRLVRPLIKLATPATANRTSCCCSSWLLHCSSCSRFGIVGS